MRKFGLLFILFLLISGLSAQQENYSRIEFYADISDLTLLFEKGIAVDDAFPLKDGVFIAELSDSELKKMEDLGIRFKILIDDMASFYVKRSETQMDIKSLQSPGDYPVPENFELGSMGGFCTNDEMIDHLDNMFSLYPNLITQKAVAGTTIEGREIYWVKISDNPDVNEDEPEVLYDGMHHAREPIGMQLLLYYMYYLLENYDTDEEVQYLVNNREMYFIPIINVDGYEYNRSTNPSGGGMWRKTRRDNGNGSYGVDPNRNYDYKWGYDNSGSSSDPWDETYRGPYAFSEQCMQTMRDFCFDNDFKIAMNYHSYSNLLLYPWGYTEDPCPDDEIFFAWSQLMTQDNGYTYGAGSTTIYPTNGGSDDWMYGEQEEKDLIFAYTPEVGNSNDGFWPSQSRIIPLCQENMLANFLAAHFAGDYASVEDLSPLTIENINGNIDFMLKRLGLSDTSVFTVSLTAVSPEIASVGAHVEFSGLSLLEEDNGSIAYELEAGIENGTELKFILAIDNGAFVNSDTLIKVFGQQQIVFEDDCNTMQKWSSNNWNITSTAYHSSPSSITDSPGGNYSSNTYSSVTLDEEIDLSNAVFAVLNFWAKWDIEAGWDYVQVKASRNNGGSWIPLSGNYTKTGNSNQAQGEPLYDGVQESWAEEEINLQEFLGDEIILRFTIVTDGYVNEDGFYFDDVTVGVIESSGVGITPEIPGVYVSEPYPVPATDNVFIDVNAPGSTVLDVVVFDINGKQVFNTSVGNGCLDLNVNDWEQGLYYIRFTDEDNLRNVKKIVVQK